MRLMRSSFTIFDISLGDQLLYKLYSVPVTNFTWLLFIAVEFDLTKCRGLYIGKYPPPGGGEISADVIWGKKYEKAKRKRGKI